MTIVKDFHFSLYQAHIQLLLVNSNLQIIFGHASPRLYHWIIKLPPPVSLYILTNTVSVSF